MKFECKGISKAYGAVKALVDVDFSIDKGEVRAILGGNGSGKSTLAKVIGGIISADKGTMSMDGKPYKVKTPRQAMQKKVVVTSQELSLMSNLSIEENLTITELPKKKGVFLDRAEMTKRARKVLDYVGLSEQADEMVADLPPHKKYMVEFAKALLLEPELLIVDEITSALFREDVAIVARIFKELSAKGVAIMFVTHRIPEIYAMCDSVTVLRNGELIGTLNTAEVEELSLLGMLGGSANAEEERRSAEELAQEKDFDSHAETLMEVKNLELKRLGKKLDLSIRKGEVIGIAGLQGQGQSDFLRTVYGLNGPVRFSLDGKEISIKDPQDSVKYGLAYISGDRTRDGAFYMRSLDENVSCVNDNILKREKKNTKELLIKMTVKYGAVRDPIESLSGGNQQKVIIGRWFAVRPRIVLADDLTKGIDVNARRDVHYILNELSREGSAVFYVSSDEEELVALSKRADHAKIIVFYDGEIVKTLRGSEITLENLIAASIPVTGGKQNE